MTFRCVEGGREVERHVVPMSRDPETILAVYDRLKGIPHLFAVDGQTKPYTLTGLYNPNRLFWLVDDVGIVCLGVDEQYAGTGHPHFTFWDKRLRGREEMCRWLCGWGMDAFGLEMLWTIVPRERRATLAFAKRVGLVPFKEDDNLVALRADRSVFPSMEG